MKSVITSKYQTTIPKSIREKMNLSVKDTLEWVIVDGKIVVRLAEKRFLEHQNRIKVGRGDVSKDLAAARNMNGEKHRQ